MCSKRITAEEWLEKFFYALYILVIHVYGFIYKATGSVSTQSFMTHYADVTNR